MNGAAIILGNPDRETVTLIRTDAPEQNERGVFEPATPVESSLVVVTHPITGEDAEHLPEAARVTATIEIYAAEVLYVTRESQDADRIRRSDGKTYRVIKVDEQKGGAWLAYAVLEEP